MRCLRQRGRGNKSCGLTLLSARGVGELHGFAGAKGYSGPVSSVRFYSRVHNPADAVVDLEEKPRRAMKERNMEAERQYGRAWARHRYGDLSSVEMDLLEREMDAVLDPE